MRETTDESFGAWWGHMVHSKLDDSDERDIYMASCQLLIYGMQEVTLAKMKIVFHSFM